MVVLRNGVTRVVRGDIGIPGVTNGGEPGQQSEFIAPAVEVGFDLGNEFAGFASAARYRQRVGTVRRGDESAVSMPWISPTMASIWAFLSWITRPEITISGSSRTSAARSIRGAIVALRRRWVDLVKQGSVRFPFARTSGAKNATGTLPARS